MKRNKIICLLLLLSICISFFGSFFGQSAKAAVLSSISFSPSSVTIAGINGVSGGAISVIANYSDGTNANVT